MAATVAGEHLRLHPRGVAAPWVGIAVAATLVGVAVHVVNRVGASTPLLTWDLVQSVSFTLVLCLAGGMLLRHAAARAVGTVLLVSGACGAASVLLEALGDLALRRDSAAALPLLLVAEMSWPLFVVPQLTFLPLAFPSGDLSGRLWRGVRRLFLLTVVVLVAATGTAEHIPTGGGSGPPLANPFASRSVSAMLEGVGEVMLLASALGGLCSLGVRWARGTALVRQQVLLLAATIALLVLWLLAAPLLPAIVFQLGATVLPLLVIGSIGVAVLRYELYETQVVLNRLAVYSILTVLLTAVFFVVHLVTLGAAARLTITPSPWSVTIVGGAVVVLCAEPVRRRLQALLERRLLGERSQPLVPIARLRSALLEEDDPATLRSITATIAKAVRSPGAAMDLYENGALQPAAASGAGSPTPLTIPLLYREECLGRLRVSERAPGQEFGARDRELLGQLADQAATIVYGLRRDAELASARHEAIQLAADERAQLGRDLHDGFASLLAGASLTAEALRLGLEPGSPDELTAAQLAERLRVAAGDVRRFAHGLQPAALADTGLSAALHDYVGSLRGPDVPRFEVQVEADGLPPAVEQATYLFVLEAVRNVVRHAGASRARIRVRPHDDDVAIEIEDDGAGLVAPYVSGVGLTSMRRRVQALDGSFEIRPGSSGGTHVTARIPVTA